MARTRKTPKTWIDAGLAALKADGPNGLRAETLARGLGTTKGSFYWHFKDVPALHDAVLAAWAAQMETRLEKVAAAQNSPVTHLRALAGLRPTPLDGAVRAWAVQDPRARRVMKATDKLILTRIGDLLTEIGATHPDFPGLILSAMVAAPRSGTHAETLVDLLLVLK